MEEQRQTISLQWVGFKGPKYLPPIQAWVPAMIEVGLLETLVWPGNRKKGSRLDEHFFEGLLHTWHRTLVSQPLSDGTLSPVASQQTFYNF